MLKKYQFVTLTAISLVCLILVVANAILFNNNRTQQGVVAARQQFIQQTVQLESLYQQMIKALAELSAKNNDDQLKAILSAQGITFSVNRENSSNAQSLNSATPAKK